MTTIMYNVKRIQKGRASLRGMRESRRRLTARSVSDVALSRHRGYDRIGVADIMKRRRPEALGFYGRFAWKDARPRVTAQ